MLQMYEDSCTAIAQNDRIRRAAQQMFEDASEGDAFKLDLLDNPCLRPFFADRDSLLLSWSTNFTDTVFACLAAEVLVSDWDYAQLVDQFPRTQGYLRDHIALSLAVRKKFVPGVLDHLIAMAYDPRLYSVSRGEAISALGNFADSTAVRDTLISLLQPKHWFWGVRGDHSAAHSLFAVVQAVIEFDDPTIQNALAQLRGPLASLPYNQREPVEWLLDHHRVP